MVGRLEAQPATRDIAASPRPSPSAGSSNRRAGETLQSAARGGHSLPFALVEANLVSDWSSRASCASSTTCPSSRSRSRPDPRRDEGLDPCFLIEHGLVPLGRFGQVLTVCMPGIVSADVLRGSRPTPTSTSCRSWAPSAPIAVVENHVSAGRLPEPGAAGWRAIFDNADAAVLVDLPSARWPSIEPTPLPLIAGRALDALADRGRVPRRDPLPPTALDEQRSARRGATSESSASQRHFERSSARAPARGRAPAPRARRRPALRRREVGVREAGGFGCASKKPVAVRPGSSVQTAMPCSAHSTRSASPIEHTAALLAA